MLNRKAGRMLALILVVAFGLSTAAVVNGRAFKTVSAAESAKTDASQDEDDLKTAADISNVTGATVEEIMKLKNEGKSWNGIMEFLKNREKKLSSEFSKKLRNEGYMEEEITEARIMAERVIFQLNEICSGQNAAVPDITQQPGRKEAEDDISAYIELSSRINLQDAVYVILKIKKEYNGIDGAMDEYLCSLQLGINLLDYLGNMKEYEKKKFENSRTGLITGELLTVGGIEGKMLEKINARNKQGIAQPGEDKQAEGIIPKPDTGNKAPEPALPKVEIEKPKNPTDDIMKEINGINEGKGINAGNSEGGR